MSLPGETTVVVYLAVGLRLMSLSSDAPPTMRAIRATAHGSPSVLEPITTAPPTPADDEVRIAVERAGVNFADLEKRRGRYPENPTPPYIPGIEVSGRVDSAGDETAYKRGDRVAGIVDQGGYAESVVASESRLLDVPFNVDLGVAAALPIQYVTAHNALFEWGGLQAGERVLIHAAAGGVGTAAVQLANDAGATVFGTASTADKRALASDLGVEHPIDYTTEDVANVIESRTDSEGVDLVLDGVGGDAFYAGVDALAEGGRIVTYGMASGNIPTVATPRLLFNNQTVMGYHLLHALTHAPTRVRNGMDRVMRRFANGALTVVEDRVLPLTMADQAHHALAERETVGKVFLQPG